MVEKNLRERLKENQIISSVPFYIPVSDGNVHINCGGCDINIEGDRKLSLESLNNLANKLNKFLESNKRLGIENIIKRNWTYLTCSNEGGIKKLKTYLGYSSWVKDYLKDPNEIKNFLKLSGRTKIYDRARGRVMDVYIIYSGEELLNKNPTPKVVYDTAVGVW